jgi:hypothetical protein
MVRRTRRRVDPFAHPDETFDYDALLEALALCRSNVLAFQRQCGVRNPAFSDARALIEQIEALALLTRVSDARDRIVKEEPLLGH